MSLLSVQIDPVAIQKIPEIRSKNDLLARSADISARIYGLDRLEVQRRLMEREALGSTGFGGSIAIPHAKVADTDKCLGLFFRLDEPIAFDGYDDKPVDLVFVLLSPENGGAIHLKALAEISRFLRDDQIVSKLRGAGSNDALYALLTGQRGQQAA